MHKFAVKISIKLLISKFYFKSKQPLNQAMSDLQRALFFHSRCAWQFPASGTDADFGATNNLFQSISYSNEHVNMSN